MAQGGPGGSTILAFASEFAASPTARPVLNGDIVLWDQRGTYFSRPVLPLSLFDDKMAHGMYNTVTCASQGDTDPNTADLSGVLPRLAEEWRLGARESVQTCQQ
jgi:hypothetical protein